MEIELTAK